MADGRNRLGMMFGMGGNPYGGMLDDKAMQYARGQGLMAGAGAGLQASGYSRTPVSTGQVLGQMMGAAQPAYQTAMQQGVQGKMAQQQHQLGEFQLASAQRGKRAAAAQANARLILQGMGINDGVAAMKSDDPRVQALGPTAFPSFFQPRTVGPGASVIAGTNPLYENAPTPPPSQQRSRYLGDNQVQQEISTDRGLTWQAFGKPQPLREPFIIQEVYNKDGSIDQIVVPRAAVEQAVAAQTDGPAVVSHRPYIPNAEQGKSRGFGDRMLAASIEMERLVSTGYTPGTGIQRALGEIPLIGNYVLSTGEKQYRQAQENWVRANLRKESGALIGDVEMRDEIRTYFPQPGDGPALIEQKRRARTTTFNAMIKNAGPGYRPGGLIVIRGDEDYRALPSGTEFIDPFGVRRRKP
jgi:hypothetical protein